VLEITIADIREDAIVMDILRQRIRQLDPFGTGRSRRLNSLGAKRAKQPDPLLNNKSSIDDPKGSIEELKDSTHNTHLEESKEERKEGSDEGRGADGPRASAFGFGPFR
jgi:hypothetical protein